MSSITTEVSQHELDEVTSFRTSPLPPSRTPTYFCLKCAVDRVMAALLLIPFLPVIGILVLAVRWTSKGPGVFKQVRVGKNGKCYTMYKLRSMRCDAEAETGPAWTSGHDPRITPLGWWLRKLHLDELPQLFNVLFGHMSLVGPRPERPEFVAVLRDEIDGYEDRLAVKPGITGLAQINLPPDTDLNSVRKKQFLDIQYTETASAWLDFRILCATAMRIVGISGATAASVARVERTVTIPQMDSTQVELDTKTLKDLVADISSDDEFAKPNRLPNAPR